MEDKLIEIAKNNLFSESPDIAVLRKTIEDELKLEPSDSINLIYKLVLRLNTVLFPPIDGVELVLTEGCNLACSYCFEKNMLGYKKMPLNIAVNAVDLLIDYSSDRPDLNITYFGGEPLLNYSVIRYTTEYAKQKAAARNKSIHFNMTSNGTLLTESMIDYFCQNNIKILLSVDGLKRTHDKYRIDKKGRGTFDIVYKNLKLLKEKQPWIGIKMTIMPNESPNLFDDIVRLYEIGVNQFIIGPATGISWSTQQTDSYLSQMKKLYEWYIDYPRSDLKITEFDENENNPFFGCHAGRTNIAVSIDGQVSPCSKLLAINNIDLISKLGDIQFGLTNFRNRLRLLDCSELRSECERRGISKDYWGGCYATNYYETQNLFAPSMHDYNFSKARRSISLNCLIKAKGNSVTNK